ncbi:hypothetical protein DSO57_1030933 [Entomophthora muscae]|uniref:Uncharacterized protein n=1 Tax=Entomophthora muscae TaxID=34485 RepID=A0ACC2SDR0_9FUNG|nr:hypothetical protein DSO57_1030933 [Entomophthora muscae]
MHFVCPETGAHTQKIEGHWSQLKKKQKTTNGMKTDASTYIACYAWRSQVTHDTPLYSLLVDIAKEFPPNSVLSVDVPWSQINQKFYYHQNK